MLRRKVFEDSFGREETKALPHTCHEHRIITKEQCSLLFPIFLFSEICEVNLGLLICRDIGILQVLSYLVTYSLVIQKFIINASIILHCENKFKG